MRGLPPRLNDFAKVEPGRGYPGVWQVMKVDGREAVIEKGNETARIYLALLYRDTETINKTREWRIARAAKIGTNIRRK